MAAGSAIRVGALTSAAALAALGGIGWLLSKKRVGAGIAGLLIMAVVGTDLWWNARTFWNYSDAPDGLFAGDEITAFLKEQDIVTVEDYFEPALREHLGEFVPSETRNFFMIGAHYDPTPWETFAEGSDEIFFGPGCGTKMHAPSAFGN